MKNTYAKPVVLDPEETLRFISNLSADLPRSYKQNDAQTNLGIL